MPRASLSAWECLFYQERLLECVTRRASDYGLGFTMNTMTHAEHITMFEQQQRKLAERAKSAEVCSFHRELAEHYARLVAEIQTLSRR